MTSTPEEFKAALEAVEDHHHDLEAAHPDMDRLLVGLLRDLGYGDAMDVYDAQPKWCA